LVKRDLEYIANFPQQVRLQVSLATLNRELARLIEPRVPPPEARIELLRMAKSLSIPTGVILAPIMPPLRVRPDVQSDIKDLAHALSGIQPDHVYGESMHRRGENVSLVSERLGEPLPPMKGFDRVCAKWFHDELRLAGLTGTWWPEKRR
jgi:DNA repair photolyase